MAAAAGAGIFFICLVGFLIYSKPDRWKINGIERRINRNPGF